MAQKGTRRKQAPAYSADTIALRYMGGLALIALGVMVFMAVVLRMQGEVFGGLSRICRGICGSLAAVLPILLVWGGGLVIWSAQRQAPVRPWIFALLGFLGICTFIMLISPGGMEALDRQGKTYGGVIGKAFYDCSMTGSGGGALGVLLGWPLWKPLGPALAIVIIFLATLFCLLMMVNLTPVRIRDLLTGGAGKLRDQRQQAQMQAEQQQVAWQQQQAIQQQQQQAMWQQEQQRRIIEQQQAQAAYAAQQNAWQQPGGEHPQGVQPGMQPGTYPGNAGVEAWQEQLTNRQAAGRQTGHQSRIFGRKDEGSPAKAERRASAGSSAKRKRNTTDWWIPRVPRLLPRRQSAMRRRQRKNRDGGP